jgi:hypothetical protein
MNKADPKDRAEHTSSSKVSEGSGPRSTIRARNTIR